LTEPNFITLRNQCKENDPVFKLTVMNLAELCTVMKSFPAEILTKSLALGIDKAAE
jgi:hypothetical protein